MTRTIRSNGLRLLALLLAAALATPAAAAPAPAPSSDQSAAAPTPKYKERAGRAEKRGRVIASEVPAKPAKARPRVTIPRLTAMPQRPDGPSAQSGVQAPAPAVPGPPPGFATTTANPPMTATPFNGLQQGGEFTNFEPPDPWVAVGPDHVVQMVNTEVQTYDRKGNVLDTASLAEFFLLPAGIPTANFDPRVIYDSLHGRWFATETSFDCEDYGAYVGQGYIDYAVSDNADPLGGWTIFSVVFPGELPDYPMAGTSTDKIAISSNVFNLIPGGALGCTPDPDPTTGFVASEIDVLDWAPLISGALHDVVFFRSDFNFTARPALAVPATGTAIYGISETGSLEGDVHADMFTITGSAQANPHTVQIATDDLTADNKVGAFGNPPAPQEPSADPPNATPRSIANAVDGRPTDALWQNGRLIWVSTIECTPPADTVERSCVRVTEVTTATHTKRQDFLLALDDHYLFHGGIGLSMNGVLHVTYTRSNVGEFPGTHAVYQLPTDATNAVTVDLAAIRPGDSWYNGNRWGDYTGVAQDPQDPNVVWQTNEVADEAHEWITHIAPLSTAVGTTYQQITPVRVLDTRFNVGLAGKFSHRVARSWQVAGTAGIPADAVAVTGNLTVVGHNGAGHVSVTPRPTNSPTTSNINFPLGDIRANNVTIPLGPDGKLSATYVAQPGRSTHLVFDVTGYFLVDASAATYNTIAPNRVVNTRDGGPDARLMRDVPEEFQITSFDIGGVPPGAVAITANVTVTQQTAAGHISITPDEQLNPPTSTINFPVGDNRANGQTLPLSADGTIWAVYKSTAGARTHFIVDVTGYYLDAPGGLEFFPLNPGRVMDTRATFLTGLTGKFTAGAGRVLETGGHFGVPIDAAAVTGNLAVTQPNKPGHLALTPDPVVNPSTSTLNFPLGDTRANGITQPINAGDDMSIWFQAAAGGTVHAILDVTGYFR